MGGIAERPSFLSVERLPQVPRTILVVDDEEGIRQFFSVARLHSAGLHDGGGGERTGGAARRGGPWPTLDLIVTDVMMAGDVGLRARTRRGLRLDNPDLKVLYVTGLQRPSVSTRRS